MKIASLKQACPRPDVVEVWDVTSTDPKLLVWLKVRAGASAGCKARVLGSVKKLEAVVKPCTLYLEEPRRSRRRHAVLCRRHPPY